MVVVGVTLATRLARTWSRNGANFRCRLLDSAGQTPALEAFLAWRSPFAAVAGCLFGCAVSLAVAMLRAAAQRARLAHLGTAAPSPCRSNSDIPEFFNFGGLAEPEPKVGLPGLPPGSPAGPQRFFYRSGWGTTRGPSGCSKNSSPKMDHCKCLGCLQAVRLFECFSVGQSLR